MYAKFIIKFPEFKAIGEDLFNIVLDEAKLEVSQKIWGRYYESGILNLTAHILAAQGYLNGGNTNAQPLREVSSKSVGSLSVGYNSGKTGFENAKGSYYLTKYGQRYLELKRLIAPHAGLVK